MKKLYVFLLFILCYPLFAKPYDVLVVGGGPAGLTAGLYSARLGLKTIVEEGVIPGGQLSTTHLVENFPGFVDGIDGPLLISNMRNQAKKYGAAIQSHNVVNIDFSRYPYQATLSNNAIIETKSVVIATGSSPKLLGLDSEKALFGAGVSTCAVCDAPLYRGKQVVVVGGGDSAFEEALMLSKFAKQVTILHRRDTFRASNVLQTRVKATPNITIKTFREVVNILDPSKGFVEGVIAINNKTHDKEHISCDGVFIAIGQKPNTSWLGSQVTINENGLISNLPEGVFAAGDVIDNRYQQAITAAGAGCKSALDAYHFLQLDKEKEQ